MIDQTQALALVKARLNRTPGDTSLDVYLMARLEAAVAQLERTGIRLTDGVDDMLLAVDLTVYNYQNRDKEGKEPDWLRARRRERWVQQRDP